MGWVRRNSTHPEINAPFVLVETSGKVRCYIRGAQGVDLEKFVNRKVHVQGTPRHILQPNVTIVEVAQVNAPEGIFQQPVANTRPAAPAAPIRRSNPPDRSDTLDRLDTQLTSAAFEGEQQSFNEGAPTPARRPDPGLPGDADMNADPAGPGDNPFTDEPGPGATNPAAEPIPPGHSPHWDDDQNFGPGGQGGPGCPACGGCGHPTCATCCHGCCGPPGRIWVRLEYLYWFTEGMRIPPLVTTGPSTANPGYLDTPGTQILYGGNRVDGYGRSGGRLTAGFWLNCAQTVGIEGDFFALGNGTSYYSATSSGSPILSRPFFDVNPSVLTQNIEQVASPGTISGTVVGNTYTRFSSAGARFLFNICCGQRCYNYPCMPCLSGPGAWRLDFLVGYRYLNLSDGVMVNEYLSAVSPQSGTFLVNDTFTTRNQFNGAELGTVYSMFRGNRLSFEFIEKVALGNMNELVTINGSTVATPTGGTPTVSQGGLLALGTNIGSYTRNEFAMIPQFGLNLGYQITPRLRALIGYTFLYVSRVARAGDQIDLNVNSTLLPNSPGPAGDTRYPHFAYQDTDFWAQGLSAGLDYRF